MTTTDGGVVSVSREDIGRIAELARLRLSKSEAEALGRDLNAILDYVDTLRSATLDEAEIADARRGHAPERAPGEREPDPVAWPPGEYAPEFRDGFFVVPSPPSLGTHGPAPSGS